MNASFSQRKFFLTLAGLFVLVWTLLALHPTYRADWALENCLVAPFVLFLAFSARRLPLSRISCVCIFVFLCLHEVGAHYTYAKVPYESLFRALTGRSLDALLGWQRNDFDRIVHFSFGLLMAYPIRGLVIRVAELRGFWGYYIPLDVVMACSMLFELLEYGTVLLFGGDLGIAYLGAQGDPWDAQKDMAMATFGAVIAMGITATINLSLQRDFAREWVESLRVKQLEPLGEEAIARMLEDRRRARSTLS